METVTLIKEMQKQVTAQLRQRCQDIADAIDDIATQDNPFDVEGKTYFVITLAERLVRRARALHAKLHTANSAPGEYHDASCLNGITPDRLVGAVSAQRINMDLLEEALRKDGWTLNATEFILAAVKEKNHE